MIIEEFKHIDSSEKEIKKFSRVVGIAFIVLGAVLSLIAREIRYLPFIIGFVLVVSGLLFPIVLLPLQKFWMGLSIVLGFISTRVILTILFYLILTPIAVIGRLTGKDFLNEKIDKNAESYWVRRSKESSMDDIKKQF